MPVLGTRKASGEPRGLMLCYFDPAYISTVPENIAYLQALSAFSIDVINLFECKVDTGHLKAPQDLSFSDYALIVIHNTVSYDVDNLRSLDTLTALKLRDYSGVKVLFKQDDNYRSLELAEFIGMTGFDLVLSCVPSSEVHKVYPDRLVGHARFENMLTGYITPTLRSLTLALAPRSIDIGYRGSIQPLGFGRLAWEKRKIGDDVRALLESSGLKLDISSRPEDRIGSSEWLSFLQGCKATLGAESGASVFDLDGSLSVRQRQLELMLGSCQESPEYSHAFLSEMAPFEGVIDYAQISPRHFEAAACHTLQLLYPGSYSGVLEAGRHYFALARDYSNLDEALDILSDPLARQAFVTTAFEEVVQNESYWIETFVRRFDALVDESLARKAPLLELPAVERNVLLLASHEPPRDPRCGWIASGAPSGLLVHQLGVNRSESAQPLRERSSRGEWTLACSRMTGGCTPDLLRCHAKLDKHSVAISELLALSALSDLSADAVAELLSIPSEERARIAQFCWYLKYIVRVSASLLRVATGIKGLHAVIATDLDTLAAALILKDLFDIPVLYDAHEFWADADVEQMPFERRFWMSLEKRLLAGVDYAQTVSPGLAALMHTAYQVPFACLPNAEPLSSAISKEQLGTLRGSRSKQAEFLFQGGFAPARGIDLLIRAWPHTVESAVLLLRGPDGAYKQEMQALAKSLGLLGTRIFFPDPVTESELVGAAATAYVGLIPYTPQGENYKNCCPNKLSQYMAAGLPVLANSTDFVGQVIRDAECGLVVDFTDLYALANAVSWLIAHADEVERYRDNSRRHFITSFNWDVLTESFYLALHEMTSKGAPARLDIESMECFEPRSIRKLKGLEINRQSMAFRLLRTVWRRLPAHARYRLIDTVRKLIR
ncbi:glycosyltransferase [Aquipseudomonas alcaligenes]